MKYKYINYIVHEFSKQYPTISDEEADAVKEYICGQNSDGLGEGFEQQEIHISYDEEIYVSFWHNGDDYWIYDEDEFDSKIRKVG